MFHKLIGNKDSYLPGLPKFSAIFGFGLRDIRGLFFNDKSPLFLSTAISELAGNMVYVALVEKAYERGTGATSVGGVLIIQAITQMVLGTWAGSLTDLMGINRANILSIVSQAVLAIGLALSPSIELIYLLAFLTMLARLIVIPARTAVVKQLSTRDNLVRVNMSQSVFTGIGFFLGPAITAALVFKVRDVRFVLYGASIVLFLVAFLPLDRKHQWEASNTFRNRRVWEQISSLWDFIAHHRPIWTTLMCLFISIMTTGAIFPLLPSLARQYGLAAEGTGIFFTALGLGTLIGPLSALILIRRLGLSASLILTAGLTPLALLSVGLLQNVSTIFIALLIAALASGCLNVIVTTILQRLSPISKQGSTFGAKESLIGMGWIISLVVITGLTSRRPGGSGYQQLFLWIGIAGILMVSWCLVISRRELGSH